METESTYLWIVGWICALLMVVGVAVTIAWSVNNTETISKEKVLACVESGGTWINTGNLCISSGSSVTK